MRVVSISVNGLAQAVDKGLFDWLADQDADVVCVQDHRMRAYEIEDYNLIPEGYQAYFIDGEKGEDGGVGIYTRHFPKAIMYGFANEQADREGRYIQADFDKVSVGCVLAPCALGREEELLGEDDLTVLDHKDEFMEGFGLHMQKTLRKRRQFVVCATSRPHIMSPMPARYTTSTTSLVSCPMSGHGWTVCLMKWAVLMLSGRSISRAISLPGGLSRLRVRVAMRVSGWIITC
jgi:hypothetical protein